MSGGATGEVWGHSPYRGATLLVHLAIGDVVNDTYENRLWLPVKKLAAKARVSSSTARAALETLVEDGYLTRLTVEDRPGVPVEYRFEFSSHSRSPAMSEESTHSRSPARHSRPPANHSSITNERERKIRDVAVAHAECPTEGLKLIEDFGKLLDENEIRYSVTAKWYDAMRLLIEKDSRPPEEIRDVMTWALSDEFWAANIHSIPTLRDKYDKLRMGMKRNGRKPTSVDTDDIVAELRRRRGES